MSSSLNIVLFGQTGSGKSSVVNLIAGSQIAGVSNRADGCTLSSKRYTLHVNGRTFHIWDTVGLDEPDMELRAIEGACDLIHQLTSQGGVDLFIFCIRAPRSTAVLQAYYRLFYEVLGRSSVPIASVITHLEQEVDMEKWWERNAKQLEKVGLKFAGHACVTGLPNHIKYQESQVKIRRLLESHNGDGRFNMPPEARLVEFSRLFGLFSPLKGESRRKEIMEVLMKRCGIDGWMAEELAVKLDAGLGAY